ncbi:hypothetical protein DSO57_1018357 [Entomophthora muscae]|uniref:Uncharacterized protein n=1 Tax=Entomophthora muscae TaxID=34485 RepID=A0ACC2SGZ8_9FUNG|nr:hypothetical protein DSO57_1018357 [Entomophthora muscae]
MPTTDWHNSSPDNSHQKESLAHGWFKYPSGHWGHKFHYGCSFTTPPPEEPLLVRPYASFYLLTYVVGYYMLGCFSSMLGRFAYLGHLGHLAMITVSIRSVIAGLNLGALVHQIGNLFPVKWVPYTFCPPDAPISPINFKYAVNLAYSDFNLENILFANPLARSCKPKTFGREDYWYIVQPCLFRDKYNFQSMYLIPMAPPVTSWPNHLPDLGVVNVTTSTQLFGVMAQDAHDNQLACITTIPQKV